MDETVVTASSVIGFVERIEDESTAFYEKLAEQFPEEREAFLAFAKDSQKNQTLVVRTYRETVSDALETGFSFGGLDFSEYEIETALPEDASYAEALEKALKLEECVIAFYLDVAERSRSLLATIPMAFKSAAKNRKRRKRKLQSLFGESSRKAGDI